MKISEYLFSKKKNIGIQSITYGLNLFIPTLILIISSLFKNKSNENIEKILSKMIEFIKIKGAKKFTYSYEIEINNNLTPDTWSKKLI